MAARKEELLAGIDIDNLPAPMIQFIETAARAQKSP